MRKRYLPLFALVLAAPAAAQEHTMQHGDHLAADVRPFYSQVKDYITKSAAQMTEANYSFKPTPEVRSFGQLVGHVANANYMICAMASGEANPSTADLEKTTAKAGLVKALQDSFTFCDRAFQITDAKGMEPVKIFEQARNRFQALVLEIGHLNEHYGNMVTYMRMKGMVPPSSQGGGM
jgi:uncharacterized damage-inducible protein DinB